MGISGTSREGSLEQLRFPEFLLKPVLLEASIFGALWNIFGLLQEGLFPLLLTGPEWLRIHLVLYVKGNDT